MFGQRHAVVEQVTEPCDDFAHGSQATTARAFTAEADGSVSEFWMPPMRRWSTSSTRYALLMAFIDRANRRREGALLSCARRGPAWNASEGPACTRKSPGT